METTVAVRGRGITKCFGDVVALDRIDLNVAQGQIHGLVGPNGAGKTTLLGLLLGLAVADEGRLEILGLPVGRALAAPDGIAGFVDGPGLYPSLTARKNLAALAALRDRDTPTAGIDDVRRRFRISCLCRHPCLDFGDIARGHHSRHGGVSFAEVDAEIVDSS